MKLTFLFLITGLMAVSASTYSQNTRLDVDMKNNSIIDLFKEIEANSEFYFFYQKEELADLENISIKKTNSKVTEILDEVLSGTQLEYKIVDRYIIIRKNGKGLEDVESITNQQKSLSGTVTDDSGEPLPGVTIVIKGTTKGSVTNIDGTYSLLDLQENTTLIFSFVGMHTQEIEVGTQTNIDVIMKTDAIGLDEVIAVGYGVQRKSDVTGSVSSVSSKQMMEIPLSRVDQALQGKMAGVNVTNTSGKPGGNVKIRIRGANSINGQNDPLVVVDGFIGGDLNTINPSDIKSIEVLKDASATAIYGSRGANGVILVSTKKGIIGKTEINISSYMSNHKLSNSVPILEAHEYANLLNERSAAFNQFPLFSQEEIDGYKRNGGTDWENEIYRDNAFQHNTQISVQGGNQKVRYYLSTNYMDQNGLIKNNNYDRFGLKSNIDADITDKITVGLYITGTKETNNGVASNGYWGNPVDNALRFPNTTPVYNEDGTYANDTPIPSVGLYNPLATVLEPRRLSTTYNGVINAYAEIKLSKYLSFKTSVGANIRTYDDDSFETLNTLNGFTNGKNRAVFTHAVLSSWQNTNTLNYLRDFNDKHRINGTLVFEQQHVEYKDMMARVDDFPTEALGFYDLGLGKERLITDSGHNESDIHSFLGRVNYGYLNRYLLTVSYRADGSSKFGKGNKWGYFPSASLAWRLSEESFIKNLNVFSNLKLRTSYGVTGSQATGPYSSLSRLNTNRPYPIDGETTSVGIGPGSTGNSELKWEKTSQFNFGADLGFFDNRLAFIFDLYKKNTTDLLLDDPLPRYTGFGSLRRNIGEVENKGIELLLTASPFVNNFKWDISLKFDTNKTEVISLGDGGQIILGEYILREGEELGTFYGFQYLGVWKENEAEAAAEYGKVPGDSKYFDAGNVDENDKKINEDDKVILGSGQPDFTFGITNNFSYKNIDLSADIIGIQGNKVLNARRYWLNRDLRVPENLRYYREDYQDTDVPGFSSTESDPTIANSRWIEDGSFVRLRNVTLGYTFSKNLINKIGLSSARLFLSGQNLVTITNYSGFDPELSSNGTSDTKIGFDQSPYPSAKIYTIGLDIKF